MHIERCTPGSARSIRKPPAYQQVGAGCSLSNYVGEERNVGSHLYSHDLLAGSPLPAPGVIKHSMDLV